MQNQTTRKKSKRQLELEMPSEAINDLFPQARYFQIHFEYLHELLHTAVTKIDALNKQVNQLEKRLASANATETVKRKAPAFERFSVSHQPINDGDSGLSNSPRTL
jgi:hypothetical protein